MHSHPVNCVKNRLFGVNVLFVVSKSEILNRIMSYYGFRNKTELASFLGVSPQTVSNWYSRNSIDYDLVFEKCSDIDFNWLVAGEGNARGSVSVASDVHGGYEGTSRPHDREGSQAGGAHRREGLSSLRLSDGECMIFVADAAMPSSFRSGDVLVCKRVVDFDAATADTDKPYVFVLDGREPMVRRLMAVRRRDGSAVLVADHPDKRLFPDTVVPAGEAYAVWEVKAVLAAGENSDAEMGRRLSELEKKIEGLARRMEVLRKK